MRKIAYGSFYTDLRGTAAPDFGNGTAGLGCVGENLHFYSPILSPSRSCPVGSHFLILADADQVKLVSRHIELGCQILHHRFRAALAQLVVVVGVANRIRTPSHLEDVALGRGELSSQAIQLRLVALGQDALVECEGHGDGADLLVVVQVRYHASQGSLRD